MRKARNANGRSGNIPGAAVLLPRRWPQPLLFESGDDRYGWDGTYRGADVPTGLYVYHFLLLDRFGREREYHGGVSLLR